MRKPKAVLISDIHFTVATLDLATAALNQAKAKAKELAVPLIICGDTLDSKAIMRGECVNRLIEILDDDRVHTTILIGNHDLINEKGKEHTLNFLNPYCHIIDQAQQEYNIDVWMIPYQSDLEELNTILASIPAGSTVIAHQGVQTAFMGHYLQDKTSAPVDAFKRFRTVSGHYHRHQDIYCDKESRLVYEDMGFEGVGLFTYIGTPYTTSFAEAHDGPKGFQILMDDGSLEFVPTNLRKHIILEAKLESPEAYRLVIEGSVKINPEDLLLLKVTGPLSELQKLDKAEIGQRLLGHSNYRLDLIPIEDNSIVPHKIEMMTNHELFDSIIDNLGDSDNHKKYLKGLWREVTDV